ncbi:MAG: DUF2231 domain-containing protein [Hydrogenobacter sp.]|uniref:DUF2231 domain-containing protein n=1 Tax=Hydrogenobacter thermophilus TaxID=940 RepID=UPI0030FC7A96
MKRLLMVLLLSSFYLVLAHEPHQANEYANLQTLVYPAVVKFHPPIVHFGISLPFATLLAEVYYTIKKKGTEYLVLLFSFLTLLVLSLSVVTGYTAHQSIEEMIPKRGAMELIHLHQNIGFVLLFLSSLGFLFKVLYHVRYSNVFRYVFIGIYLLLCAGVVYQGSLGGKLVYEYSVGVPVEVAK